MNQILSVEFLEGSFKRSYLLMCNSQNEVKVAGVDWMDTYTLEVNLELLRFWNYVKSRYGVVDSKEIVKQLVPITATINRKKLNPNSSFWEHQLILSDNRQEEIIVFHPHICTLDKEENE